MPRARATKTPAKPPANSVIASAARITGRKASARPKSQGTTGWQAEAWKFLDTVGELSFYAEWIENAMSRVTLYIGEETPEGIKRVEDAALLGPLRELYGGDTGQPQMLSAMGGHLAVPGETWLVGLTQPPQTADAPDTWRVLSNDEVKITNGGASVEIDRGDGATEKYRLGDPEKGIDPEALVIRIWDPHPRKWVEANSSVRAALPVLRQIEGLDKHTSATIDSRLAGAGIFIIPSEATFDSPVNGSTPGEGNDDPFLADLMDTMTTAIADRGDASAVVPIVLKVPGQYVDKVKHIAFATQFQAEALELEDRKIRRLANSLNVPAEVLMGLADVNHWTGWLLDDNSIKMHIEPLANVITHGLTTRYYWPALQGNSLTFDPALRRYRIFADTSALRQRPNRSTEAQTLHDKLVITDAALARETGFEESDLLSADANAEEFRRRLTMKTAGGVTTADVTVAALANLGVTITPKPSEVVTAEQVPTGGQPDGQASEPPAIDAPRNPPEQQAAALLTALVLGSEPTVLRAVERGWNKAGRRGKERRPVEAHRLDDCLIGAWEYVPRIAAMTGTNEDRLHRCLDAYARGLLATGAAHDPMALATRLRDEVLGTPPEALSA